MTVTNGTTFSHISVKGLHPTFGAVISGVDFSSPLNDEIFAEIYQAVTKVLPALSLMHCRYRAFELNQ